MPHSKENFNLKLENIPNSDLIKKLIKREYINSKKNKPKLKKKKNRLGSPYGEYKFLKIKPASLDMRRK